MASIGRVRSTSRFSRPTMPATAVGSSRTYRSSIPDAMEGDSQFFLGAYETSLARGSSLADPITSKAGASTGGPSWSVPVTFDTGSSARGSAKFVKRRGKSANKALEGIKEGYGERRIPVHIRRDLFKVMDGYAKQWTTELGIITRFHAPIYYQNWRAIPVPDKQFLFDKVAETFEVNYNDPHCKEVVEMYLKDALRGYMHRLKSHYDLFQYDEVARCNPFNDVRSEIWQKVCDWFNSNKFKERSKQNKKNRSHKKIPHCAGSKSFVQYLEEQRKTSESYNLIDFYKDTHHKPGKGWSHPDAQEQHMEMVAKSQAVEVAPEGATSKTDFEIMREVLGYKEYYLCGLGHGVRPNLSGRCTRADVEAAHKRAEEAEKNYVEAMERVRLMEERIEERIEERLEQRLEERLGPLLEERIRAIFSQFRAS